jgi:hypothetical protein
VALCFAKLANQITVTWVQVKNIRNPENTEFSIISSASYKYRKRAKPEFQANT